MLKDIVFRFLLVFLSIETILQETTIYRRRQKLSSMKNGLGFGGAYEATLGRIRAQGEEKARLGLAVLMWISHSRRPLLVDEICHATAIRIGSNDLDSDDIPAISTLLGFCQGLVTVDKGASTVRLIHFTLQEYLYTHPDLFDRAHSTMAEVCLTYLNFQRIKDLPADPPPHLQGVPFLEYSSLYWGTHMRIEPSYRAEKFALELLDQFDSHISAKFLWKSVSRKIVVEYTPARGPFSALHCISYFGIAGVTDILIRMSRWDVNQRDSAGVTALIWAARYGHEEVVRLLLREKHIQPDQEDTNDGRTALSWAAGNGHEGVVKLLLGRGDINPSTLDTEYGRTPLSWAAENGREGAVKLLLGREDINPDSSSKSGRTPLSWASGNGCKGVVMLLLGRKDVSPDSSSKSGRTPLSWAAGRGRDEVVTLLLRRKAVDPDNPNKSGRTPLSWAAGNGCEGVVKLLLERKDVNLNTPNKSGRVPLSWAAWNGHLGVVKLLLQREDINPDTPDTEYGQTPLSLAAEDGYEGVVKLLLGREDVNLDTPDTEYGRTPLSWAAGNGREGVVKLLLGRKEVNPDSSSKSGQTPLLWAAENGHGKVVELLEARVPRRIQ